MSQIEFLKAEMRTHVADAQAICAKADAEKRDLTAEEAVQVDGLVKKARAAKDRILLAEQEEQAKGSGAGFREEMQKLGDSIARPSAMKRDNLHPRVKASGGSDWGHVAVTTYADALSKSIVPDGQIFVNVPLDPEPVRLDIPVLTLRQMIPNVQNSSGHFSYVRQVTRTNNAAVVAKGAKKPESDFPWERVDGKTSVIAHISSPVARQDLDDIGMLRNFIDQEMRLGLELALEREIMTGDGTGAHLTGIANVSGSQSQAWSTDLLTTARKAVTKLEQYGYLANAGFVMSAADWEAFELTQDNEARFYYGGPVAAVNASSRRLWGVPVVVSNAATTGTAYLADFQQMRLHVREEGNLRWSENIYRQNAISEGVGASDFERNLIAFLFEGRFGLEIQRPSAIVEIDLTA